MSKLRVSPSTISLPSNTNASASKAAASPISKGLSRDWYRSSRNGTRGVSLWWGEGGIRVAGWNLLGQTELILTPRLGKAAQLPQRHRQHRRIRRRHCTQFAEQLPRTFDGAAIVGLPDFDQRARRFDVTAAGQHRAGDRALQAPQVVEHRALGEHLPVLVAREDRKSTRLNSSHLGISYAVFCLKKKKNMN